MKCVQMKSGDQAIIIMVNFSQYPDLEEYQKRIGAYSDYTEFYGHYARGDQYYEADRSDIDLHIECLNETGACYWCVPAPGNGIPRWLTKVKIGYFSIGQDNITHRLVISDIRQWRDFGVEERAIEDRHIIGSRCLMWEDPTYYGEGTEDKGHAMIWIKITKIEPLPKPLRFNNFVKALTHKGEAPRFIRSYAIVQ